jgi:hypothetical protein
LALNPADKADNQIQLCPQNATNAPPELRQEWTYPDLKRYRLDDGVGLQAFVLLASRRPLPPYAEWRRQAPALHWKKTPATIGFIWQGDRDGMKSLRREGDPRGTEVAAPDAAALDELRLWLRSLQDIEATEFRAFAVAP